MAEEEERVGPRRDQSVNLPKIRLIDIRKRNSLVLEIGSDVQALAFKQSSLPEELLLETPTIPAS